MPGSSSSSSDLTAPRVIFSKDKPFSLPLGLAPELQEVVKGLPQLQPSYPLPFSPIDSYPEFPAKSQSLSVALNGPILKPLLSSEGFNGVSGFTRVMCRSWNGGIDPQLDRGH